MDAKLSTSLPLFDRPLFAPRVRKKPRLLNNESTYSIKTSNKYTQTSLLFRLDFSNSSIEEKREKT